MGERICPRCQIPQRPTAKFCRMCGYPLDRTGEEAPHATFRSRGDLDGGALSEASAHEGRAYGSSSGAAEPAVIVGEEKVITLPWEDESLRPRDALLLAAPVVARLQAMAFDLLLTASAVLLAVLAAVALLERPLLSELTLWGALAALGVLLGNHLILCGVRGQSVGMALAGIRIVCADGRPLSWGRSLLRHTLGYVLAVLPLGLGLLWMVGDQKNRGWHDLLSRTWVVRETAYD